MKNSILALLLALGLGVAFVGYATISGAAPKGCEGNYADERSDPTRP